MQACHSASSETAYAAAMVPTERSPTPTAKTYKGHRVVFHPRDAQLLRPDPSEQDTAYKRAAARATKALVFSQVKGSADALATCNKYVVSGDNTWQRMVAWCEVVRVRDRARGGLLCFRELFSKNSSQKELFFASQKKDFLAQCVESS